MNEESLLDQIGAKNLQEAIDAGFTEEQAKYLVEKLSMAGMGFGGLFM
jgi:hypothetical protein